MDYQNTTEGTINEFPIYEMENLVTQISPDSSDQKRDMPSNLMKSVGPSFLTKKLEQ